MKDLSIVIVNWNTCDYLKNCLNSVISNIKNINYDILVFDNNSKDNSIELLKTKFPNVKLYHSSINIGFGKANNVLIKNCDSEFILILNPDTLFLNDSFEDMFYYFKNHPKFGALGCKILNTDNSIQYTCTRSFPDLWTVFCEQTFLYSIFKNSKLFAKHLMTYWDHNDIRNIDLLSGAMILTRKSTLTNVNNFDEDYFMYGEDIDLCWKIKQAGWDIVFYPFFKIIHYGGKSTIQSFENNFFYSYVTLELFFSKYKPSLYMHVFRLFVITGSFIRILFTLPLMLVSNKNKCHILILRLKVYLKVILKFIGFARITQ